MNDMKRYLKTYKKQPELIHALAERCDVSRIYLTQLGSGHYKPSAVLARKLDEESAGEIRKGSMRPDVFGPVESSEVPVVNPSDNLHPPAGD